AAGAGNSSKPPARGAAQLDRRAASRAPGSLVACCSQRCRAALQCIACNKLQRCNDHAAALPAPCCQKRRPPCSGRFMAQLKLQGTAHGIPGTEVEIDPTVETFSGLSKVCYASCKDILTREQTLILRTVGVLSDAAMQQIEVCLKTVLAIR